MDMTLASNYFIAMLALVNPLGKIPIWIKASADDSEGVSWRLALMLILSAAAILALALHLGVLALDLFGIDLVSFRVGGGLIIVLVGIDMLHGMSFRFSNSAGNDISNPRLLAERKLREVFFPLAVPFIAGPGTLTTTIMYGSKADSALDFALLNGALALVLLLVLSIFLIAHKIRRLTGDLVLEVITRLFGLILVTIGVQFILEGLGEVFPNWMQGDSPLDDDILENRKSEPS